MKKYKEKPKITKRDEINLPLKKSGGKLVAYAAAIATICTGAFFLQEIYSLQNDLMPGGLLHLTRDVFSKLRFERTCCIVAYIVLVSAGLFYVLNKLPLLESAKNLLVMLHAIIITLLMVEGVFMFIPKSGGDNQLSQLVWMNKYWRVFVPVFDLRENPMNLREIPGASKTGAGNGPTIFVVGASFGAGDGINDPDSIFSSLIYQKIFARDKLQCQMVNICEKGDGPWREYDNMIAYSQGSGITPNVVIWEYSGTDIEEVARRHHKAFSYSSTSELEKLGSRFLEKKSFLGDYIYWNSIYKGPDKEYQAYLEELYKDTAYVAEDIAPIKKAEQWCKEHHTVFVVAIFPLLTQLDWSKNVFATPLTNMLTGMNIPTINLTDSFKVIPIEERIVNNKNTHPSKHVHAVAASAIFDFLVSNKKPAEAKPIDQKPGESR